MPDRIRVFLINIFASALFGCLATACEETPPLAVDGGQMPVTTCGPRDCGSAPGMPIASPCPNGPRTTPVCERKSDGRCGWSDGCSTSPAGACGTVTDGATCAARSDCRWLIPGCSAPALAAAGCFDRSAINCTPTSCPAGKTCVRRSVNPCAPAPSSGDRKVPSSPTTCAACGAEISVCL
ncbi:MAG TPA: hypothetical protein VGF45_15125 [Polyangia bacterium]